jgi:acyl-CoA dehydrogenase
MLAFDLSEEQRSIRQTVRRFVERELMPLEPRLLRREVDGGAASPGLTRDERRQLEEQGKAIGFWGIDTPGEYGGADLDPLTQAIIHEELGRSFVDFDFGGSVLPVLFSCDDAQKQRYLLPTLHGERISSIAISEPGGGSDAKAMRTTAVCKGSNWVINGEKTCITRAHSADYVILFARTPLPSDEYAITCFLVDRNMGWTSSFIPLMGSKDKVGSIHFDDVVVPETAVLGEVGKGFAHGRDHGHHRSQE